MGNVSQPTFDVFQWDGEHGAGAALCIAELFRAPYQPMLLLNALMQWYWPQEISPSLDNVPTVPAALVAAQRLNGCRSERDKWLP